MKKILAVILALCFVLPCFCIASADGDGLCNDYNRTPFNDLVASSWYYTSVEDAFYLGYFSGTAGHSFGPSLGMNRAMFVTVLAKMAKADLSQYGASDFYDVASDTWYTKQVAWAAENGIVSGYGNGAFMPDAQVTREQICTMILAYADYEEIELTASAAKIDFADSDNISAWAYEAVEKCQLAGVVSGCENNMFLPQKTATRAEMAVICDKFARTFMNIQEGDYAYFPGFYEELLPFCRELTDYTVQTAADGNTYREYDFEGKNGNIYIMDYSVNKEPARVFVLNDSTLLCKISQYESYQTYLASITDNTAKNLAGCFCVCQVHDENGWDCYYRYICFN